MNTIIDILSLPLQTLALNSLTKLTLIILFSVAPTASLPVIMQRFGGMLNAVTGTVSDKTKGLFDRNKNWRGGMRKEGYERSIEGKSRAGRTGVASIARRAKFAREGGFSVSQAGRARYRAATQGLSIAAASKAVEQDGGRSGGDDDLMDIISSGKTEQEAIGEYATRLRHKAGVARQKQKAEELGRDLTKAEEDAAYQEGMASISANDAHTRAVGAVAAFKSNFGIDDVKGDTAQVAAFKALLASNTSLRDDDFDKQILDRAGRLVDQGAMTSVDAAAIIKSNKQRAERSGVGFSAWMGAVDKAATRRRTGQPVITAAESTALRDDALNGSEPGQIMGGRHETVRLLAPRMQQRIQESIEAGDQEGLQRNLARVAAMKDVAGQVSGLKNDHLYSTLMNTKVVPIGAGQHSTKTIDQLLEETRAGVGVRVVEKEDGTPLVQQGKIVTEEVAVPRATFLAQRREYGASEAEARARGRDPSAGPGVGPTGITGV